MTIEHFHVVALPHSVADDAPFHVSVYIAPELTPDGGEGELGDFGHFPNWAEVLLNDATFELRDQSGVIDAEPILDPIDPAVWEAIFPPDTPVRGRDLPDWSGRHWRTFPAAEVHHGGKLLHLVAMFTDPVTPPAPSIHPLGRLLDQALRGRDVPIRWDESVITRSLDARVGETGDPAEPSMSLAAIEKAVGSEQNPFTRLTLNLHRARRFYERPESKLQYRERPLEQPVVPPVPRPEPDFHERCSLLADHPALQRITGLVVDLRVDTSRLKASQWLSARIVPQGDTTAARPTRVRCGSAGDALVVLPRTEDWSDGMLRVGDGSRFAVLDMDPDGTALKLERYLWTIPRLLQMEDNGDPAHAAPAALRSLGFTVVRNQKALGTQAAMNHQLGFIGQGGGDGPLLDLEDVTQGFRVEVWDDTAGAWHSVHLRRITAEALGHGAIVENAREVGFLQTTTATETPGVENSPVHIHETVFGWDGWSLAAPRPGKRVRHAAGEERVEDPDTDPDPITPLVVHNRVEQGTLPRLRYGREYAFRAFGVDLAGNSRDHDLGAPPPPDAAAVAAVASAIGDAAAPAVPVADLASTLRSATSARLVERSRTAAEIPTTDPGIDFTLLPDPEVDGLVLSRLRSRRADLDIAPSVEGVATVDRASLVTRTFADAVLDEAQPFIVDTAALDPERIARVMPIPDGPEALPKALDVVTPLRPFLRWDPVQPPAIVSRHGFSDGESLRQLVIRSGVTQDPKTLEISVEDPVAYAAANAVRGYVARSERHLVPPKTSQSEAELHGAFDAAIGSIDPTDHKAMLAVALREAGTLFDVDVPRLSDPLVRDPQPGIALANDPTVPPSTMLSLPLPLGVPPAPGQYVIHDTDQLVLPYLPDVAARGISLVFPEAGRDRALVFPFGTEGFTAGYSGNWPDREPFRLVLAGAPLLAGSLAGNVVTIELPPGDIQRFRLSSSLAKADLDLFGLWRILPAVLRSNPDIAEAAADGWLWAFTPFDDVTLVHAVPRPLEAPRSTLLRPVRVANATDVAFFGGVDVHGPSTDSLTLEGSWVDPVDDLSLPKWHERPQRGVAFTTVIRPEEDLAVLGGGNQDLVVPVPGVGPVWIHSARHQLGDTKHRTIRYRFRAATRFREYFDPAVLAPPPNQDPDLPKDDGQSVVGPEVVVSVPSSANPAAPIVHSVLPLFRWDAGTEPEQPVGLRRRRRAGVRIYLERPWFSSGEGELLGVVLAPGGNDAAYDKVVSQWGADPVWLGAPVARRGMFLELDNLLRATGLDDRPGDALPVVPPAVHELPGLGGRPVTVLGYRPQYNLKRRMWYVDVAIDPGNSFWPFVRLSVARYQPDSINGCHLSKQIRCDFVQLTPERITSVSRTDVRHVRVVVSGPVGVRTPPPGVSSTPVFPAGVPDLAAWVGTNRVVVARLQKRDPNLDTDLGWDTVAVRQLEVRGTGRNAFEAAWVGELEASEDIALQRPGTNAEWRVTVEEWERLPGDPADLGFVTIAAPPPVWEQRLIYADEVLL